MIHNDSCLISICIPCFNAEDTIQRAINSALKQTWENKEILVADDCSNDNSVNIVQQVVKQYNIIKFIQRQNNGGPAATRNTLWKKAIGKYIVFFDDDDESYPERIATQLKLLKKYEKIHKNVNICCYASGERLYKNGYRLKMPAIGSIDNIPVGYEIVDYLLFNGRKKGVYYGSGIPACSLMIKRKIIDEIGGFDEKMKRVEDADLSIRIGYKGGHFIGCSENLFLQYATTAKDKSPKINNESELFLINKNKDYLNSLGLYEYALDWNHLRYFHFSIDLSDFSAEFLLYA